VFESRTESKQKRRAAKDLGDGAGQVAFENEMSGYFTRAAELLECPAVIVEDHSEEMKGYGQVLFSTARLQFSRKVLDKLYQLGHDGLYIERLLQHI
jgi:hypothetical protein